MQIYAVFVSEIVRIPLARARGERERQFRDLAAFGYGKVRRFLLFTVWSIFAITLWLLYTQAFILPPSALFFVLSGNGLSSCWIDRRQPFFLGLKKGDPNGI